MDEAINRNISRKQTVIFISGIVIAILFPFVLSILIRYPGNNPADKIFYSRFTFWAEVLLLMLYASKAEHRKLLIWNEKKTDVGFFLASVIVLYLLSWVCSIVGAVPRFFGYHENNGLMKKIVMLLVGRHWLIFFVCFTAGVTEELIFRGYVMTRLSLLFKNKYLPIILSALGFSALHYGYKNLHELIFAFLIGIIFGIYYQKYRNIKVLVVAHFAIDFINMEMLTHFYKLMK
ncbi:MAG: CPBP family intramembrane metalloprotease [Bacteroidetes bacterium]|nr:CPBP family intramembrane metalloprotease [Bacteroidota bacterium]